MTLRVSRRAPAALRGRRGNRRQSGGLERENGVHFGKRKRRFGMSRDTPRSAGATGYQRTRSAGPSRRQESPSEGEEEPPAAGAERLHVIRQTVEAASGRAARRRAEGTDPKSRGQPRVSCHYNYSGSYARGGRSLPSVARGGASRRGRGASARRRVGCGGGNRTPNLPVNSRTLYQFNYPTGAARQNAVSQNSRNLRSGPCPKGQISTKTSSPSRETGKVWVSIAQGVSW